MSLRRFFYGGAVLSVGLTCTAALWLVVRRDFCDNVILQVANSLGGEWQAVAFKRNCGATTSESINISLLANHDVPHGSGNIFVAEAQDVTFTWHSPSLLEVVSNPDGRVFRELTDYSGIKIRYSPRPL